MMIRPTRAPLFPLLLAFALTASCVTADGGTPRAGADSMTREEEAPSPPAADPAETGGEARTGVRLLVEPFADLFFRVRAQAAGVAAPDPALQPIVDAWMPVQEEIGAFGGFWRFDLGGLLSDSPAELAEWFADFPDTVPSRAGGTIPIRTAGVAMAEAMTTIWPEYLREVWPARRAELDEATARLEREFLPRHREALRHMLDALGIADPEIEVPTHLVLDAHPPGASTYRTDDGPIAVLSTRDLLGEGRFSDLAETILHETCHALDAAAQGDDDAFSVLRRLLRERGVDERDPRLHDIPHLLMFAQAESTMRRIYDPRHVAYGDTWRGDIAPLYERSGDAAVVVRREWSRFLDGERTREAALHAIVEQLVAE